MARRHSSFLVRCWNPGSDDEERIEIEHIQSGAKTLARSVADATEWIRAQCGERSTQPQTAPARMNVAREGRGQGGVGG